MSRQKQGVRLPHALQKELGLVSPQPKRKNGFRGHSDRKAATQEKSRRQVSGVQGQEELENPKSMRRKQTQASQGGKEIEEQYAPQPASKPSRSIKIQSLTANPAPTKIPSRQLPSPPALTDSSSTSSRTSSPEVVLDANSRSFKDRQANEDAEIAALEKRLGIKKGKNAKLIQEDGFGDLLNGLDDDLEHKKRKERDDDKQWIEKKRRKLGPKSMPEGVNDDVDDAVGSPDTVPEEDEKDETEGEGDPDDESGWDGFSGFESEENSSVVYEKTRVRENPYVAPVPTSPSTAKYVPPSLRIAQSVDGQNDERLRRQLQGHLNKLSEANFISILNDVEKIYQWNPRQDVTSVLIDLLLSLFCSRSSLPNSFVILHAAFITATYRVIGTDFGAEMLSRLVDHFAQYHNPSNDGKESLNLLSLLSNLFIFNLVSSAIIYDHIHLLLESLTERNTEILLRLIRDCGPQLRSDDPSALRSIVSQTQSSASALQASGIQSSVRTSFMIETIMDLKNNKMRDSTATSNMTKDHITRMRKVLGSLNSRSLRATEPLRISLVDLQNSDKKGKWWLVGASWKGNGPMDSNSAPDQAAPSPITTTPVEAIPKDFGLSTPLQHLIFTAISTSHSYIDAHIRLMKLRLKRSQEPEIARVILCLCSKEKTYNPFYAHVAKRLCSLEGGKRVKKTFDFALWSFFRRLGERGEEGDEDEDTGEEGDVSIEEINNVALLYANLVHWGLVSLSVLKILDLAYLKENAQLFVEMMLVQVLVLCQGREDAVERVFEKAAEAMQVVPRLKLFLKEHVKTTDLVGGGESEIVRKGTRAARRCLEGLSMQA